MHAQANDSMVELDDVKYGVTGAWALNVWIRVQSLNRNLFEYVYSHNSTAADPTGWGPDQVGAPATPVLSANSDLGFSLLR